MTFPCIRQSKTDSLMIYFTGRHSGTVLTGNDVFERGEHSTNWADANDKSQWEDVEENIISLNWPEIINRKEA